MIALLISLVIYSNNMQQIHVICIKLLQTILPLLGTENGQKVNFKSTFWPILAFFRLFLRSKEAFR